MNDFFNDKINENSSSEFEENKKEVTKPETQESNDAEIQQVKQVNENQDRLRNLMPDYSPQYSLWDYRVGIGRRIGAALIDFVIVGIITSILYYATGLFNDIISMGFTVFTDPEFVKSFVKQTVPISLLVSVIYFSTEILLSGTPGKHILGIIIADEKMIYAGYGKLAFRALLKHLDLLFMFVYFLTWSEKFQTISSIFEWIIFAAFLFVLRANKEALYDSFAKTAVYFKNEVDSNQESKSINN